MMKVCIVQKSDCDLNFINLINLYQYPSTATTTTKEINDKDTVHIGANTGQLQGLSISRRVIGVVH